MASSTGRKKTAAKKAGKNKDDFRSAHDKSYIVPKKIREGIEQLGKEGWEYEREFLSICGLSNTDAARYREEFEDYLVQTGGKNPKRIWAGSPEFAEELREMAG